MVSPSEQIHIHRISTTKTKGYKWSSPDVIAVMLVHRTKERTFLWECDSSILQNMSHKLLPFCAPTWPSYHVIENHLLTSNQESQLLNTM